jgi:type II secretion system protein N
MPRFLRIILYPAVFFLSLGLFFIILFPFGGLKERFSREIESAVGQQGYRLSLGDIAILWPNGIAMTDVEVRSPETPDKVDKISRAEFRFALFDLMSGIKKTNFNIRSNQGKISGTVSSSPEGVHFQANLDRFDLAWIPVIARASKISVTGTATGRLETEIFYQDPLKNSGSADLQILELGLGEFDVGGGVYRFPAMKLAGAGAGSKLDLSITKGNFDVKTFQLLGGDVGLDANGKVYGAKRLDNYRFNLKGGLTVTPEFATKFPIIALIEKQKAADGSYPFTVTGRLLKPSIRIGDFRLPL